MLCQNCQQPLPSAAKMCSYCNAVQNVFCIHCGQSLAATAEICSQCGCPQFGEAAIAAAIPRYTHSTRAFNIAVPTPWEVAERNLLGFRFTVIDRPDARHGFKANFEAASGVGPATLQIWPFGLRAGSDFNTLNQAYTQVVTRMGSTGGSGGAMVALALAAAKPTDRQFFNFGGLSGMVFDYRHSMLGVAKTIERRFLVMIQSTQATLGAVMIHQTSQAEFAKWNQAVSAIASSFRFGAVQSPRQTGKPSAQPTPQFYQIIEQLLSINQRQVPQHVQARIHSMTPQDVETFLQVLDAMQRQTATQMKQGGGVSFGKVLMGQGLIQQMAQNGKTKARLRKRLNDLQFIRQAVQQARSQIPTE